MTNEQVLRKAIEKAVKNGWKDYLFHGSDVEILFYNDAKRESFADTNIRIKNGDAATNFNAVEQIIFDHDFARAFARYIQADKRDGGDLNEKLGCLFSYWWIDFNAYQPRPDEELDMIMNDFLIDLALERDKLKYLAQFL